MEKIDMSSMRYGRLSSYVYEVLKESIIHNKIQPGSRLTEKKICEMLSVSATPVREAFNKLSNDGLIEVIPYKGVRVMQIDSQDLDEVYSCRIAFERLSVKQAIENYTSEFVDDLYLILEKSESTSNHQEYVEANTLFHNTILDQANNKRLKAYFKNLENIVIHNRMHSSYSNERKNEINEEHQKIMEAIAMKEIDNAQDGMEKHISNGYTYMKKALNKLNKD